MKELWPCNRLAGETLRKAENLTTLHFQEELAFIPNQNIVLLMILFKGQISANIKLIKAA